MIRRRILDFRFYARCVGLCRFGIRSYRGDRYRSLTYHDPRCRDVARDCGGSSLRGADPPDHFDGISDGGLGGRGAAVVFGVDQSLCVWERGHGWRRHQAHGHGRRFYRMATGLVGDHAWVVSRIGDRWRAHDFRCHIPSRAHSFRAVPRDWLSPGLDLSSVIIRMVLVPDRLPCVTPQKWLPEPF